MAASYGRKVPTWISRVRGRAIDPEVRVALDAEIAELLSIDG
jgi:hypothetical protein